MTVSIDISAHIPRLQPGFAVDLKRDVMQATREWAVEVQRRARLYPPKRPGQKYQRTLTLKRGWKVVGPTESGGDVFVSIENDVPYSDKVHGNNEGLGQAQIHRGRWPTIPQIQAVGPLLEERVILAMSRRLQTAFK